MTLDRLNNGDLAWAESGASASLENHEVCSGVKLDRFAMSASRPLFPQSPQ